MNKNAFVPYAIKQSNQYKVQSQAYRIQFTKGVYFVPWKNNIPWWYHLEINLFTHHNRVFWEAKETLLIIQINGQMKKQKELYWKENASELCNPKSRSFLYEKEGHIFEEFSSPSLRITRIRKSSDRRETKIELPCDPATDSWTDNQRNHNWANTAPQYP